MFYAFRHSADTVNLPVYSRLERDLYGRTDQFGVEIREWLKWDIREAMVSSLMKFSLIFGNFLFRLEQKLLNQSMQL